MAKEAGWNPTLLDLLKEGARITFQDGLVLSSDPANGAIHTHLDYDRRIRGYKLNIHGLEQALKAIMEDRAESDRQTQ